MIPDPPPFQRFSQPDAFAALLVCDHASWQIPSRLQKLGLEPGELQRHIGWDIGAFDLAQVLSRELGIGLVAAGFSRLVIDCNRHLDDPSSIVASSDGTVIPGNQQLPREERRQRARDYFDPYHLAIEQELQRLRQRCEAPVLIAIHSFTPVIGGVARPWHCGILWDRDPRIPVPLLQALGREKDLVVGDNEPYSGRHPADYTIERHAESQGRAHVCLEIRQDQLENEQSVAAWAKRLTVALRPILSQPALYRASEPYRPERHVKGVIT